MLIAILETYAENTQKCSEMPLSHKSFTGTVMREQQ